MMGSCRGAAETDVGRVEWSSGDMLKAGPPDVAEEA